MGVRAEGHCLAILQFGEKERLESELSRLGYWHERFELKVRRARSDGVDGCYYVCVTELWTSRSNVYFGGLRTSWVEQCLADLVRGFFGAPSR